VESRALIVIVREVGLIVPSSGAFAVADSVPSGFALPESAICEPEMLTGPEAVKPAPARATSWLSM
jgi:hypothetical protein